MEVVKSQLTDKELEMLQLLNTEMTKFKLSLADLELRKHSLISNNEVLRKDFMDFELMIADKYGADCTINVQTGEVTYKK